MEKISASLVKLVGLLFLIAGTEVLIKSPTGLRAVTAALLFVSLTLLIWKAPKIGVSATFIFLALLGGVRRWLIPDFGWPAYDPFVIVGAAIPITSFFPLLISKKIPADTPLSKGLKYLLVIMVIQFFNPFQGGFLVAIGGVLYYTAPLLWFYVGRTYGNKKVLSSLIKMSVLVYSATAVYGLKQVLLGLSASEQAWMHLGGYDALNVSSNAIRVFSTYASQQEYAITLSCVLSVCVTYLFFRKGQYVLVVPIVGLALLLTAARGPIVALLLSGCIQWASLARKRSLWLPRLGFALCIGVVGLIWSLSGINTAELTPGQRDIIAHQQEGLLDPAHSTASDHMGLIGMGIFGSFSNPLGSGLGSTTLAAGKLGGGVAGSEMDYANLFNSLGLIGGVLYLVIMFWIFKQCSMLWRHNRDPVYLALLGILIVVWGQWLSGGLYSLCFLIWFSIGVLDREFAAWQALSPKTTSKSKSPKKKLFYNSKSRKRTMVLPVAPGKLQ